jgi:hypothetical protein
MSLMPWVAANCKNGAAPTSMIGQTSRPPNVTTVECQAVEHLYGAMTKSKAVQNDTAG